MALIGSTERDTAMALRELLEAKSCAAKAVSIHRRTGNLPARYAHGQCLYARQSSVVLVWGSLQALVSYSIKNVNRLPWIGCQKLEHITHECFV